MPATQELLKSDFLKVMEQISGQTGMEFVTFDCQKFSTHTRKFLLPKCNLYAHFESLESSSLLGQGVESRQGVVFLSNHLPHHYFTFLQSNFYPHYLILPLSQPCKLHIILPILLTQVKKFNQDHLELVSKKVLTQTDFSATEIGPESSMYHLSKHLILK